jgi:hypothetical protein
LRTWPIAACGHYWKGYGSRDIADAISYVVTRPQHVAVNEMLIRPTGLGDHNGSIADGAHPGPGRRSVET